MARKQVTEQDVMKALGALEEDAEETEVAKGGNIPEQMKSTKKANGGFSGPGGEGKSTPELETTADEKEPVAKSEEAEEEMEADADVDGEEIEEPSDEEVEEIEEPTAKSVRSAFKANDTIRKGVEVSPFLESLTDVFGDEMDKVVKSIEEGQQSQEQFNAKIQKAIVALGNLSLQIAEKLDAFGEQPARARKSLISKSEVVDREFEENGSRPQFSKSQVLDVMMDLVEKSELPPLVVSTYETTDFIPGEYMGKVEAALRSKAN